MRILSTGLHFGTFPSAPPEENERKRKWGRRKKEKRRRKRRQKKRKSGGGGRDTVEEGERKRKKKGGGGEENERREARIHLKMARESTIIAEQQGKLDLWEYFWPSLIGSLIKRETEGRVTEMAMMSDCALVDILISAAPLCWKL